MSLRYIQKFSYIFSVAKVKTLKWKNSYLKKKKCLVGILIFHGFSRIFMEPPILIVVSGSGSLWNYLKKTKRQGMAGDQSVQDRGIGNVDLTFLQGNWFIILIIFSSFEQREQLISLLHLNILQNMILMLSNSLLHKANEKSRVSFP